MYSVRRDIFIVPIYSSRQLLQLGLDAHHLSPSWIFWVLSSLGLRTQRARTRSLPRADLVMNEPPFPSYLTPDSGVYHCPTQGHGLSIGYSYPSVSRFLRSPILAGSRRCKLKNMVSLLPALAPAMESSLGTRSNPGSTVAARFSPLWGPWSSMNSITCCQFSNSVVSQRPMIARIVNSITCCRFQIPSLATRG